MAAVIQMKLAKGFSGKNNKALEEAGKVKTPQLLPPYKSIDTWQ
jgi:hypothetical protein